MRRGGLLSILRALVGDALRTIGLCLSSPFLWAADVIDPIKPAREWNPRLWDRDGDARADNEERP